MLLEGRLLHTSSALEGALVARAGTAGAVSDHVHVAVGGGRVRTRYLRANLARLRRGHLPAATSDLGLREPDSGQNYRFRY